MILVTLCFVAVLGIALASYLAVCSRAMQLSNRAFQNELSKQLAEAGLEEGLRAFNKNNWDDWTSGTTGVDWTLDTTNKRATGALTFPSTKFGQGVTTAIKIRVDNYDANVLGTTTWSSSSKSYRIYDVVGYGGAWYRCLATHTSSATNGPPNLEYWAEAPIPWAWGNDVPYTGSRYALVNYGGVWYRYVSTTASTTSTNSLSDPRYWRAIPSGLPLSSTWVSGTTYFLNSLVIYSGSTYICTNASGISPSTTDPATDTANWTLISHGVSWQASTSYSSDNLVVYGGAWYYCISPHTSSTSFDSSKWRQTKPLSLTWTTNTGYARGAIVFNNGYWYYCNVSHLSGTFSTDLAASPVKWVRMDSPAASTWISSSSTAYYVGDYVYYSGTWYRCIRAHTSGLTAPSSDATNWTSSTAAGIPNPYIGWMYRSGGTYDFNDVVYYSSSGSGTWYRRNLNSTTTGAIPTNTSYWENALSTSWGWSSSATYNIGDVVYASGSFYRCIRSHSNKTPTSSSNADYWSADPAYSNYWDSGKNYGSNDTVRYRGSWYLSLSSSHYNNRPGTDATYWAIAPRAIEPWSSTKNYHLDDLVSSGSAWYRCIKDHTNQAVSSSTYWVAVAGATYVWSSSTAYSSGSYVSYGGLWYKCIANTTANAGHTPNNTTYWTPTWSQSSGVTTGAPVVYADATVTLGDGSTSKAQLRAVIDPAPLFPNAAGANTTLTITGGTGTVDSYDSELPNASDTNGDNYVATDAGYSAVLAAGTSSASGTSTLLSVGASTTIQGYLTAPSSSSSPYPARTSFATSVSLKNSNGTVTAPDTTATNVDLARIGRTPYIPQFDILTPIQHTSVPTSLPSTSSALNLGTPGAPTPSVYYYPSSLNIASGETVNINGPVIFRINGYLLCNTGTFNVSSTGSVVVHMNYVLRSYASAGGFQNKTKLPKNMLLISTNTTSPTTADYLIAPSSSPEFYGAIYMPNVTATLGMEIRTGVSVFGALSAREVTFSTEANLHYDTSLRYATFGGVDQPYTVTNWTELGATEQATMP